MSVWDAEVEIDGSLVRHLLEDQFPELDASSARLLAEGWDNSVWVVEERWAFRFPRRSVAVPLVRRELAVLPRLAPIVPLPIPVPALVGRASDRFPWPFFACELLPGSEPAEAEVSDGDRVEMGADLGRFLRAVHEPSTREAVDPAGSLPVDPNRRADTRFRSARARTELARLAAQGVPVPGAAEHLLRAGDELAPPAGDLVLVHGDLHARHVLVRPPSVTAVIDWGDVCLGDPAIDLSLVWSFLPPAGHERFFGAYGEIDGESSLRARVLAVGLCAMLAVYARSVGHAGLEKEVLDGIERTLADDVS